MLGHGREVSSYWVQVRDPESLSKHLNKSISDRRLDKIFIDEIRVDRQRGFPICRQHVKDGLRFYFALDN
jgi:hypothetical protein